MEKSTKVGYCCNLLENLGNLERIELLKLSSLTLRERAVLTARFVEGLSAKECANKLCVTEHSFTKIQRKIFEKFYLWLEITNRL